MKYIIDTEKGACIPYENYSSYNEGYSEGYKQGMKDLTTPECCSKCCNYYEVQEFFTIKPCCFLLEDNNNDSRIDMNYKECDSQVFWGCPLKYDNNDNQKDDYE